MDLLSLSSLSAAVRDLEAQAEVSRVLAGVVDRTVDEAGRQLIDELRVELEHALGDIREAEGEAARLRQDRDVYVEEANKLRSQLVHDFRNIMKQLNERDELQSQLKFLQQRMLQLSRPSDLPGENELGDRGEPRSFQQTKLSSEIAPSRVATPLELSLPHPAAPSYSPSTYSLIAQNGPHQPPPEYTQYEETYRAKFPSDILLRKILLDTSGDRRIPNSIFAFMEGENILAFSDAAMFYNRLVQWMFDESEEGLEPPQLYSNQGEWTNNSEAEKILQDLPLPPLGPPPPYTATMATTSKPQKHRSQTTGFTSSVEVKTSLSGDIQSYSPHQSRDAAAAKAAKSAKAELMARSLSRKELKEVAKLGARCKQLEAKVMVLKEENNDLNSMIEAAGDVKGFLLSKIKDLEDKNKQLQGQTDNDKQIIGFLDSSVHRQEGELEALKNESSRLEAENASISSELMELRTQKKVLVAEVKRLRKKVVSLEKSTH